MLERSRAIKCPSAAFHLAGTKKVQQVLAEPGVLERCVWVGVWEMGGLMFCLVESDERTFTLEVMMYQPNVVISFRVRSIDPIPEYGKSNATLKEPQNDDDDDDDDYNNNNNKSPSLLFIF